MYAFCPTMTTAFNREILDMMKKSAINRNSALKIKSTRKFTHVRGARKQHEQINDTTILAFIKTFKPFSESTNAPKVKKRNTNVSRKIIANMKQNFDSLPPGYLKSRRSEKLNTHGKEQRNRYRKFLDTFRDDLEISPPLLHSNIEPNQISADLIHTELDGDVDSLLREELSYQGDYIGSTMEELYSIASGNGMNPLIQLTYHNNYTPYVTQFSYNHH